VSQKNCGACQKEKLPGPQYGHLPPREAALLPWEEVALDLIGPWTVQLPNESYDFYALTCIDTVTNFPDAIRLRDKTASHVGMQFENLWLSRYPHPIRGLHDRGTEFMGVDFQRVLQRFGIKDVAISVRNPQANAVCERLHQSVGNALRVFLSQGIPQNVTNVAELVDSALATALHAS
jgi:transposase InsO family protein